MRATSELCRRRKQAFAEVDLYPVTSAAFSNGRSTFEILDAVIAAGCKAIQLREKELSTYDYYQFAEQVRRRSEGKLLLICNDHLDVALAVGADGVHLGRSDLPLQVARRLAPELIIGASTHSLDQALTAQAEGADYVNIGPIFSTETKASATSPLGPEMITQIASQLKIPFTVMGGINASNIDQVLEAGARRIAVVTAVTAQPDPAAAAKALRRRIVSFCP